MNSYLRTILHYLIALAIVGLTFFIGSFFVIPLTAGLISILLVTLVLAIGSFINLNAFFAEKRKRDLGNPFAEDEELKIAADRQRDRLQEGLKKLQRLAFAAKIFASAGVTLALYNAFALSATFSINYFSIIAAIPLAFLIKPAVALILPFHSKTDERQHANPLDYPIVYSLARNAAKTAGVKAVVNLSFSSESSFDVNLGDDMFFEIGLNLLGVLTKEEAQSLMTLEAVFKATPEIRLMEKLKKVFPPFDDSLDSGYPVLFVEKLASRFRPLYKAQKTAMYPAFRLKAAEKYGDAALLGAYLKMQMHNLFNRHIPYLLDEPFYKSYEPRANGCSLPVRVFAKTILEKGKSWSKVLLTADSPRNSLYLAPHEIATACHLSSYEIVMPGQDDDYGKELRRIIGNMDKALQLFYALNGDYSSCRQAFFIQPSETVERFEIAGGLNNPDINALKTENLRPISGAYADLLRFDKVEKICDFLIARGDADDYSLFMKGKILICRGDDHGVNLIMQSVERNPDYFYEGALTVLNFYRLTNRKEEERAFRIQANSIAANVAEKLREMSPPKESDKLAAHKMNDVTLSEIVLRIAETGNSLINKAYAFTKKNAGYPCVYIVLIFEKNVEATERHKIMKELGYYLSEYKDRYCLLESTDLAPAVLSHARAIKKTLIYENGNVDR